MNSSNLKALHLDFETFCDLDLKKVGIYRYVNSPSFRVLAVAWRMDSGSVRTLYYDAPVPVALPLMLIEMIAARSVQIHAWNAAFELAVLTRLGITPANHPSCTMQRALAYGIPASLAVAGKALGVPILKDKAGHRHMLEMSKPQKAGAAPWTQADYERLAAYCGTDVKAEEAIGAVIPQLQPEEIRLSKLDWRMNTSGALRVDYRRISYLEPVALAAEKNEATRCATITGGEVTAPGTQTAKLLTWLQSQNLSIQDVTRATVEDALAAETARFKNHDTAVKQVLEIRLRAARASTKKLVRMVDMSEAPTGMLRGQFQFLGAARTGRWSGRGVQVQNLPRVPKNFDPDMFAGMARHAASRGTPDSVDMVSPAPVLDCVSWSLRSCLIASSRYMWGFDFAQIEARVLAWLAGQHDVLKVFASGDDIYTWTAAQFGSGDRQLGKVLVLALGFGMGASKLQDTARKSYGVSLTNAQAEGFKTAWRLNNKMIVKFWYDMDTAARTAIMRRGVVVGVEGSGIAFVCTARTLQMRLPSGRVLYYHRPLLKPTSKSNFSSEISYWGTEAGVWGEQRTWGGKLAENATQAVARDVMAEAMLRVDDREVRVPVMTVHDELVYGVEDPDYGSLVLGPIILEPPPWAGGLPIAGESKLMSRYGVKALAAI